MEHNRASKFQSMMSVESRKSNISNPRSLGRPSFEFGDINLESKTSLVYAMSISSDPRKSDFFQRLLIGSQKKQSLRPSSIVGTHSNEYNSYQLNEYQNQRNSQVIGTQNQIQIDHECNCFENCLEKSCACFLAHNEICVRGACCSRCVQLKNISMQTQGFYQPQGNFYPPSNLQNGNGQSYYHNNIEQQSSQAFSCNCKNTQCLKSYCKCFQNGQFCSQRCGCESCKNKWHSQQRYTALQAIKQNGLTYCTCKKTKCNKKYCSCYAQGMKCGKYCSCENCTNCDKVNEMDLQVYEGEEEQNLKEAEMPERMSFEPVSFE